MSTERVSTERVLHEWTEDGNWIRQISADGKSERIRKGGDDGSPWSLWMPTSPETEEIARLAARVAELEGENAKLRKCADNCGALARRNLHKTPGSDWAFIHRWCSEVGFGGTVLRAARAEVENG